MDEIGLASCKVERDQWLGIALRHLAALATVADQASFSAAAESLGYVQSAVSQQIGSLERIVGHRLVDRSARPRSVTVTDAGRTMLDHVDEILEQLRLAKAEIDMHNRHGTVGPSVGVASVFGDWLCASLFGTLLPSDGGNGWERVERAAPASLLEGVQEGRLDAALVPLPLASGPFFALELTTQPYVLAFPNGVHCDSVEAVLERWPLVVVESWPGSEAVRRGLAGTGATPVHTATGPASAMALARAGSAAAVVTKADLSDDEPAIATLALPELPPLVVGVAWHRDRDQCTAVMTLRDAARRATLCWI